MGYVCSMCVICVCVWYVYVMCVYVWYTCSVYGVHMWCVCDMCEVYIVYVYGTCVW